MQHTDTWVELFAPLHCLNFGIHRDKIENVLWRIQNGELDNVKPKVNKSCASNELNMFLFLFVGNCAACWN